MRYLILLLLLSSCCSEHPKKCKPKKCKPKIARSTKLQDCVWAAEKIYSGDLQDYMKMECIKKFIAHGRSKRSK